MSNEQCAEQRHAALRSECGMRECAGQEPYARYKKKIRKRIKAQSAGESPYPEPVPRLDRTLASCLQRCLHPDPKLRPRLEDMMHLLGYLTATRLRAQLALCECASAACFAAA
jgi:hypothetical protein